VAVEDLAETFEDFCLRQQIRIKGRLEKLQSKRNRRRRDRNRPVLAELDFGTVAHSIHACTGHRTSDLAEYDRDPS
jgi:hypothetical protein